MKTRFDNLADARVFAAEQEAATGERYTAYQSGFCNDPFITARLPQVGDEVSMSFNGDTYPIGQIDKISPTYNRITANGIVFTQTGPYNWVRGGKNGTFSMIKGLHRAMNPSF
jgi:hypothetical protein